MRTVLSGEANMKEDSAHPSAMTLNALPARAARAHALKNCLAVVDSVNVLVADELSDAARQRMQRAHQALRRMARLIEEELQSPWTAVHARHWEVVAAAQVLSAVRVLLTDLAEAKRVRLDFRFGPGSVRGDLSGLIEALGNVVKNAVESSPSGSTVVIESARTNEGGQLWSVRDTGPGIPGHFIEHLGVPFRSHKPGGSGLGFAVACDIVQLHGGRVHVESAQGWGTLVSIALPRTAAE